MKALICILVLALLSGCGLEPNEPTTYWAYGDSITEGSDFGNGLEGYSYYIANKLELPYINRGVGGSRIAEDAQVGRMLADPIKRGDIVTLLTGYNDVRFTGSDTAAIEAYAAVLDKTLLHLNQIGARVYLGNCLRMAEDGYSLSAPFDKATDQAVAAYNSTIADIAAKYPNVTVIDVSTKWDPSTNGYLQADRVHPSQVGAEALANLFLNQILRGVN